MWALLDKSLQIINCHPELEKLEIRSTIKRFLRFYSFLIQATCFESVDIHKKYNFLSYLVKEIEVGCGGNDFDIRSYRMVRYVLFASLHSYYNRMNCNLQQLLLMNQNLVYILMQ